MNFASLVPTITDLRMLEGIAQQAFYAHLVSGLPALSAQVAGQLSLVSGINYSPLQLTNVRATQSGAGAVLQAAPITWIGLTTNEAIAGVVFCVRSGSVPSNSDWLFSSIAFVDSAGLPAVYPAAAGADLSIPLDEVPFFQTRA